MLNSSDYGLILPSSVVKDLQQLPVISAPVVKCAITTNVTESDGAVPDNVNSLLGTDVINAESVVDNDSVTTDESNELADVSKLITEQQHDASLSQCWQMAEKGKGGFVVSRGVLYHKDKVCLLYTSPSPRD